MSFVCFLEKIFLDYIRGYDLFLEDVVDVNFRRLARGRSRVCYYLLVF